MIQALQTDDNRNQGLRTVVDIDGKNLVLNLQIRYNEKIDRWLMTVMDEQENVVVWNVPLVSGQPSPSANLLYQLAYKWFGSACAFPIVDHTTTENPTADNLGLDKEFAIIWGDTVGE